MTAVCKEIRTDILKISKSTGHGHIPTCFSVVEILYAVYRTMNHNPKDPSWGARDIFILSKGHASLAHYCVLAHFGYFDLKEVYSFGGYLSDFGCHADRAKVLGIEAATGSLGHGIGIAVGTALAFKIQKSARRVFVLIGDGEANEGSVWESILVAVNLNLDNLTIIYDDNKSHSRGLQICNALEKFKAFGCQTQELDGHNLELLEEEIKNKSNFVRAIVANTKKGFGCKSLIENHYAWHRKSPNDEEFKKLMEELSVNEKTV